MIKCRFSYNTQAEYHHIKSMLAAAGRVAKMSDQLPGKNHRLLYVQLQCPQGGGQRMDKAQEDTETEAHE